MGSIPEKGEEKEGEREGVRLHLGFDGRSTKGFGVQNRKKELTLPGSYSTFLSSGSQ
jgi:hypothetical protein